jgi:hypothetical protein
LAEEPAKLIKQFWQNFEWNSNSAGMQELPQQNYTTTESAESVERPMTLGVIKKQTNSLTTTINNTHPPLPPSHHHDIITINLWPHSLSTMSRSRTMWQHHITYGMSGHHVNMLPPLHHTSSTTPITTVMMQHINGPLQMCSII